MAGLAADQGSKRKRVFRACDSCRAMKSKCDGARPACGRCTGYGYKCLYGFAGKRNHSHRLDVAPSFSSSSTATHDADVCSSTVSALQLSARDYSNLVRAVLPKLPEAERQAAKEALRKLDEGVANVLNHVHAQPPAQGQSQTQPSPGQRSSKSPHSVSLTRRSTATTAPRPVERYLGEVSDVRFFNLVDRALADPTTQSPTQAGQPEGPRPDTAGDDALESYEQDDPSPEAVAAHDDAIVEFPGAEAAGRLLDIYFSTIHVAYPYLPRALFMQAYEQYLASPNDSNNSVSDIWLATMYTLFATGAYYDKAATSSEDTIHEQYYRHALALASTNSHDTLERSLHQVSFLLAQCFYLLAVCRTDKCWTTLGLAVRIAQSIGLHVDSGEREKKSQDGGAGTANLGSETTSLASRNAELRRRVWYSIYVLDRLLALQLGRPPAIHDEDCHLLLPSRLGDADIDWLGAHPEQPMPPPSVPTTGDYFVRMIYLSRIIGYVLRDLYSPRGLSGFRTEAANNEDKDNALTTWLLPSTKRLDRQLLEWRRNLPRKLRFDFGHAFDAADASPQTVAIYKRQRNMLAIKFHHLRAVIHRPYLCQPLLHNQPDKQAKTSTPSSSASTLRGYETVCILEARATAHLLHNVVDKQNLVHDFPWWQMISCLVYASSILVVASAFARRRGSATPAYGPDGGVDTDMDADTPEVVDADATDAAALEDDAETCLTVFEALSPSSESARLARDMMRRLKARGAAWREVHGKELREQRDASEAQDPRQQRVGDVVQPMAPLAVPGMGQGQGQGPIVPFTQPMADMASLQSQMVVSQPGNAGFIPLPAQMPGADVAFTGWPPLQEWPLEILDSMEWSTQFFNAVDGQQ